MRARGAPRRWLIALLAASALGVSPRVGLAADEPAPSPSVGLKLSDKPPPGCCCTADPASPDSVRCAYGLHEDKCRWAGKNLGDRVTTWTPGKCPKK